METKKITRRAKWFYGLAGGVVVCCVALYLTGHSVVADPLSISTIAAVAAFAFANGDLSTRRRRES